MDLGMGNGSLDNTVHLEVRSDGELFFVPFLFFLSVAYPHARIIVDLGP